jgi:peptidyl-prolyl cis-trans isomerase A (cyclophilin A)
MVLSPAAGLIQGGTSGAADRVLPPIAHEPTSETGLTHTDGALSMARFDPGTATGDFFIIVGNVSSLDAGKSAPGDPGFAVFGRVVEGMDIVRQILAAPKSPTEGEGFMRGQMLDPRIRIVSVRRVPIEE